jgi:tetratricopeptide (TPR) repeat protein
MKQLLLSICALLLVSSAHAQKEPLIDLAKPDFSKLVNLSHTEKTVVLFKYYEEYIWDNDSATIFNDIKTVRQLATTHNDNELLLVADLMEAHYYAYRYDNDVPFMTQKLTSLINKAEQLNALWLQARTESLLGTRLFDVADYEGSFLHLTKAVKLLENEDPEEHPIKQICIYLLAHNHLAFKEYGIAVNYLTKAIAAGSRHDRYYYYMHILNETAFCYRKLNKIDSSNHYFRITLNHAQKANDTLWQAISYGNLGENYYLLGDYTQAEPLLIQDAEFAKAVAYWGTASNSLAILGDIELKRGNLKKAHALLTEAHLYAGMSREYKRLQLVYPLLAKLYAAELNPEKAMVYMDSAFYVNDSLKREFDYIKAVRAHQQLEREETNAKLISLESERAVKLAERNMVIALLVAFAAMFFLIFTRLQKRFLKNKVQLQNTTSALEEAQQQLKKFTNYLADKNKQIEVLKVQAGENVNNSLTELQDKTILTEEDWDNFKLLFNKVHTGFLERLAKKHPNVSQAETRFIALTKMEVTPKQMTAVLGVGDSTIRQVRSRLKRKLSIESPENLEQLINSI